MKTVLLFGTFDGLHEGHKHLLSEAKKLGDRLVVVLALDAVVRRLKGRDPMHPYNERFARLSSSQLASAIIPSDKTESTYYVIHSIKPDVVVFGYDQQELREDFAQYLKKTEQNIPTVTLAAFEPERYKSSLINHQLS